MPPVSNTAQLPSRAVVAPPSGAGSRVSMEWVGLARELRRRIAIDHAAAALAV